ncbi:hypothetical protein [Acetonema longum]|uniref:Uncharacterized protein n=1 Tax=Acetonema longum DSM 6540 TaxID=1009370 RepID=F7NKB2_9FIRM|nr:hypothetical protein [Acetonema longum]EGO63553.1 hypothetical protein ALO_12626 [Acetonema longum DSM 6540]
MDKMTSEKAIEILRDKFIEFYPSVAGVKPISIRRAMEIVDFIKDQQSRIVELETALLAAKPWLEDRGNDVGDGSVLTLLYEALKEREAGE